MKNFKLLLVLFCAVTYHYCDGYPVTDGEISEEVLIENGTAVEYLFDTTNVTSSNDTLLQHGVVKKVVGGIKGGIKSIKTKIGSIKDNTGSGTGTRGGRYIGGIRNRTNSGSGKFDPTVMWVLIGLGLTALVTIVGLMWYFFPKKKTNRGYTGELQQGHH